MKYLITGITGMVGSEFYRNLSIAGADVYGLARSSSASRISGYQDPRIFRCDISDRESLEKVFDIVKPNIVIHMAAQAFNGLSWDMENYTHQINYLGTLNVLKCSLRNGLETKVLLACSSAEYGDFDIDCVPLKENTPLRPLTPYGVSKVGGEMLGIQYFKNYGLQVFLPRMFIHVGPGHPPATAIQNFAKQLAEISIKRTKPILSVGNLSTSRDFIDVRDGVEAMLLLLEKGEPGKPINICTGKAYKIEDILNILIEISGIEVNVEVSNALLRKSDEPVLLGDNSEIMKLGFQQKYDIKQTLTDIYNDWIERVKK